MIGQFINRSKSVIGRQRQLSPSGHLTNHLFVKFVNSSRKTLARVIDAHAGSDSIRIDELMILMDIDYNHKNQRLRSARSSLIISAGFDESEARSRALTRTSIPPHPPSGAGAGPPSLTVQRRRPRRSMTLEEHMRAACVAAAIPSQTERPRSAGAGDAKPRVLLALDLGQRTGWAVRNRDGAIASGTHEFRPRRFEGGWMVWLRFRAWPQEIDETSGGVGVVVFEEVHRHLGTAAGHAYGGYLAHLTAWAEANKIPYRGVPVGTIKRHVTGKGNADKAAVIAAVRKLGFQPADDDEARATTSSGGTWSTRRRRPFGLRSNKECW